MNKEIPRNEILVGDAKEKLEELPDNSIDTAMTSPPYWGLRDYGHEDQLGLEETPEKYVENLMEVFNELQRVLKPTGTFYLNIDDSYGNPETSDKCMAMIPERVMMAMVDNGWILRNKVVWNKPNPMPESVKDRFSTTWEYVYMFSLQKDYHFDLDAIREPHKENSIARNNRGVGDNKWTDGASGQTEHSMMQPKDEQDALHSSGKNPGDTWEITTAQMPEAHFAVYPPELCEKPVKAGCPKKVCAGCGKPYERVTKEEVSFHSGSGKAGNTPEGKHKDRQEANSGEYDIRKGPRKSVETLGFDSTCDCETEETEKGIILDPFSGAGTTCLVARQNNRDYLGLELNEEYADIARNRIKEEVGGQPLDKFLKPKQSSLDSAK